MRHLGSPLAPSTNASSEKEREIVELSAPMKELASCQLYTFIDRTYLHGRFPTDLARALCDGGTDLIQLRMKDATALEVQKTAEQVLAITSQAGVLLVINDHLQTAIKTRADFCHLGQEDFFDQGHSQVRDLPGITGSSVQIGLSTHAPEQALRAIKAGADYIAIGPVYPTPTKPFVKAVTLEYVRWAAAHVTIPWFAIGGITLDNLDEVFAAGARRICVVSAILNARDVRRECEKFRERLDQLE